MCLVREADANTPSLRAAEIEDENETLLPYTSTNQSTVDLGTG